MLLPNRLDQRIAEAIRHQIDNERTGSDTTSDAWRSRCEVAKVAMFSDAERSVFIHHVSERRGSVAAHEIESQAKTLRTNAIFFLARKPS
jgi:phage baseplate assembly protein W